MRVEDILWGLSLEAAEGAVHDREGGRERELENRGHSGKRAKWGRWEPRRGWTRTVGSVLWGHRQFAVGGAQLQMHMLPGGSSQDRTVGRREVWG